MKLTKPCIDSLDFTDPTKPEFHWDSEVSGFGVKVSSKSKSYVFQGRVGRKTIRVKIGDVKNWKLKDARDQAKRLSVLCNDGINPLHEKAERISQTEEQDIQLKKQNIKFKDAWKKYLEENKTKWRERSYLDHIEMARGGFDPYTNKTYKPQPIHELLELKLSELTKDFFVNWLDKNNQFRKTSTSKSYRLVRAFLNWCEEEEAYSNIIPKDSYSSKKVKRDVQKTKAKNDCLLKEQLKPWFKEILEIENKKISVFFIFALLTGARKNEILTLEWKNIDFKWKTIHLKDKVNDEGRTIPMTKYIESNLKELKRHTDSVFVFSSERSETGHIVNPYKELEKIRKNLHINITIHGLRRSFETLSGWIELPKGVTHQISGHKADSITEKHYTVRPMDMLRMHMQGFEDWILEIAEIIKITPTINNV
ncbi:integrase family protein [Acinetobacter ursingii]|uniref:tyrosine-type recombinase/integrase n=1 Tax=Acinetobacter ursingii TaxID=108980 RepID=UPI00125007A7|nr:integrase family protein [Acinetobacter ursingii]MCU4304797.1 integrase family protein [Acinetobacter ursingii]MCU4370802.1 integrase family protein [Acinetobacter ursingii]MDG9991746.1 integrase family protein [Acinetobacter ursingii]MDH0205361.1 integrase family protein [Acinetobacter ursingii]